LGQKELSRKMALDGKRYAVENYSWGVIERKVNVFLEESAGRRPGHE
jgi:hypothetical protein